MTASHSQAGRKSIAIIGAGISGLGAAWALRDVHDVTIYESENRLGGHANTATIDYEGQEIQVDTGFIVFNALNYPNFTPFLDELGVKTHETDMSFGFSDGGSFEWSSNGLGGLFANPKHLIDPSFHQMIRDILRFNKQAPLDLESGALDAYALGDYLKAKGYSAIFAERYLLAMGAAIWSASTDAMMDYPAEAFVRFFNNHRLMHTKRPKWRSLLGGSQSYVHSLSHDLSTAGVNYKSAAFQVERNSQGVRVRDHETWSDYDEVILACHSDQALKLLSDPSEDERRLLGAIGYAPNRVILHRDTSYMPKRKGAYAAWNYRTRKGQDLPEVTYDMNRLQGIPDDYPLYVTLNPAEKPRPDLIFGEYEYEHPQFTTQALKAQREFNRIQGPLRTWFAGAWLGYGFHEDGLRSGLRIALKLGGQIPWTFAEGDVDGGPFAERPDLETPTQVLAAE